MTKFVTHLSMSTTATPSITVGVAAITTTSATTSTTTTTTVELRWLEPLWDHENLFKTWVVRATEG